MSVVFVQSVVKVDSKWNEQTVFGKGTPAHKDKAHTTIASDAFPHWRQGKG